MAIRIDKIKINRGGPLQSDFKFEPGDLNLIYGHNETGKTYIVESMIKLLFRAGTKSTSKWEVREWDIAGKIVVSGLENGPQSFTKRGKKLEEFWEEEFGLPSDLSRFLVVNAGDTVLAAGAKDGVGRSILKDCLSGEGFLDNMNERIQTTIIKATILNHEIIGDKKGQLSERAKCKEQLYYLKSLLEEVENSYCAGEILSLQHKIIEIETEINRFEEAKRHFAFLLDQQKEQLLKRKHELPSGTEISEIEVKIGIYDDKASDVGNKTERLSKLESKSNNYTWALKAREEYDELVNKQLVSGPSVAIVILLVISFLCAVTTGYFRLNTQMIISSIGTLLLIYIYFAQTKRALSEQGINLELENLKQDFYNRFGIELKTMATLDDQIQELNSDHILATSLKKETESLYKELSISKNKIIRKLKEFTGDDVQPGDWTESIDTLKSNITERQEEIDLIDDELKQLAVKKENFLNKNPGVEWDSDQFDSNVHELQSVNARLNEKINELDDLKLRIRQEIHSQSDDWDNLLTELNNLTKQASDGYKNITAEILAKMQISSVIEDFRKKEDVRIADGLKKKELLNPLQALTAGRYQAIRHDKENELILTDIEDDEYPLSDLSTGAKEQILIALRIGFASVIMKENTAFLILDDAFQHSDWNRRKEMVAYTKKLVEQGWQVFYFAMDDHIRTLFEESAKDFGGEFKSFELR